MRQLFWLVVDTAVDAWLRFEAAAAAKEREREAEQIERIRRAYPQGWPPKADDSL